jgi:hypothetical protein
MYGSAHAGKRPSTSQNHPNHLFIRCRASLMYETFVVRMTGGSIAVSNRATPVLPSHKLQIQPQQTDSPSGGSKSSIQREGQRRVVSTQAKNVITILILRMLRSVQQNGIDLPQDEHEVTSLFLSKHKISANRSQSWKHPSMVDPRHTLVAIPKSSRHFTPCSRY